MAEALGIISRAHRVAADFFSRRAKNPIEIIVEGKFIFGDVIDPVAGAGHLERIRQLRFAGPQSDLRILAFGNIMQDRDG